MLHSLKKGLESARLRLDRAKKHIEEFCGIEDAYLARDPIQYRRDIFQTVGVVSYHVKEYPPETLALSADDALGNMRESLDHALFAFTEASGIIDEKALKAIQFPTADTSAKFPTVLTSTTKNLDSRVVTAVAALEPYPGGKGESLYHLHHLANLKKHRILSATPVSQSHGFARFNSLIFGPDLQKFCLIGFTPIYGWESDYEPRVLMNSGVSFSGYDGFFGELARHHLEMIRIASEAAIKDLEKLATMEFG